MAIPDNPTGCFAVPAHFLTHLFNKLRDLLLGRQRNNISALQPQENTASFILSQEQNSNRRRSSNNTQDTNQTTTTMNIEKVEEISNFVGGKSKHDEVAEASMKLIPEKTYKEFEEMQLFLDDEDVCPTCLEEYSPENPKITTKCCHDFHLGCIYEWKERSDRCPICYRVMVFEEAF
ncbi:hypothetical protein V2J09_020046 [Rumex salicifolius]